MASQTQTAPAYTDPSSPSVFHRHNLHQSSQKKPWQARRRSSFKSNKSNKSRGPEPEEERLSRETSRRTTQSTKRTPKWWKIRFFRGMIGDVKRRAPYYRSDWTDAWDYRVVPATVYMYFANILPALAFSLDMFVKTDNSYGVNEVLLASVLGCVVFSLFAAQPLVIVGITGKSSTTLHTLAHADGFLGPITVFSYTVYDIVTPSGTNFFAFMAWVGIWSLIMHWILAITNSCNGLTYVTRFSCDIFGFYVAFIYLQKGIQVLTRQWGLVGPTSAYFSVMVSLLVLGFAYGCGIIGESNLFHRHFRKFIEDYGTPLTIIFFTGFAYFPGHNSSVDVTSLPVSKAFFPTKDRSWFVNPGDLSVGDIFLALPFGLLLTILFWFDHNVSSLIAQGTEFPLRKPPGFHWDIFLLGLTTFIAGILGIPFPNGLIPQAPFHTKSLCVTELVPDPDENHKGKVTRVVDHVVEQRVSNLAQGLLFLVTMTGPLLIVLHLIPQGVLAGLFFVMGSQALAGNGITLKLLFLAKDKELTPASDPLKSIERRLAIWVFVAIELVGFAATFAITQTIAAIGFPVIIMLLIPIRTFAMPKWFRPEELAALDAPTAGAFVMESVGGAFGETSSGGPTPNNGVSGSPDETSDESAVDDTLERGEGYQLRNLHSQRDKIDRPGSVRRRSLSSRGRGRGESSELA